MSSVLPRHAFAGLKTPFCECGDINKGPHLCDGHPTFVSHRCHHVVPWYRHSCPGHRALTEAAALRWSNTAQLEMANTMMMGFEPTTFAKLRTPLKAVLPNRPTAAPKRSIEGDHSPYKRRQDTEDLFLRSVERNADR